MRTRIYSLSAQGEKDSLQNYIHYLNNSGGTNKKERKEMKKILALAINRELTNLQKKCLTEYYLGNKKQVEIARELGVNKSTVSRHISAATKKLQKIAFYTTLN